MGYAVLDVFCATKPHATLRTYRKLTKFLLYAKSRPGHADDGYFSELLSTWQIRQGPHNGLLMIYANFSTAEEALAAFDFQKSNFPNICP